MNFDKMLEEWATKVAEMVFNRLQENAQQEREQQQQGEKLLKAKEVCNLLGISPQTLWRWRNRGLIKPEKYGDNIFRYRLADVQRLQGMKGGLK